MSKGPKKPPRPTFQQDWKIGNASAENDSAFLEKCFVDTGALSELCSSDSNKSIILGRVGAGKSTLVNELEKRNFQARRINPQDFSLKYISGSSVLQFVSALGVKLDPVFQALWKHVLCVELIKLRYNIASPKDGSLIWQKFLSTLALNESKKRALDYFAKFGGADFWETTEVRVREITQKIEQGLEESIKAAAPHLSIDARLASKLTDQDRI